CLLFRLWITSRTYSCLNRSNETYEGVRQTPSQYCYFFQSPASRRMGSQPKSTATSARRCNAADAQAASSLAQKAQKSFVPKHPPFVSKQAHRLLVTMLIRGSRNPGIHFV